VFLSILNLINFIFSYSIFYININEKLTNFSLNILVLNSWLYIHLLFFKYNSFFYKTMLLDINSFDYNKQIEINNNKKINVNCLIYYFFLSKLNLKLNIYSFVSEISKLQSISHIFNNSQWVERELAEMYGIYFLNKMDSRNLLLDYSYFGYPLLKIFPVTGNIEIYFNFLKNWISYTPVILKESHKVEFYFY